MKQGRRKEKNKKISKRKGTKEESGSFFVPFLLPDQEPFRHKKIKKQEKTGKKTWIIKNSNGIVNNDYYI